MRYLRLLTRVSTFVFFVILTCVLSGKTFAAGSRKPRFEGAIEIKGVKYIFRVDHGQTIEEAAALFGQKHNLERHLVDELVSDMTDHLASKPVDTGDMKDILEMEIEAAGDQRAGQDMEKERKEEEHQKSILKEEGEKFDTKELEKQQMMQQQLEEQKQKAKEEEGKKTSALEQRKKEEEQSKQLKKRQKSV